MLTVSQTTDQAPRTPSRQDAVGRLCSFRTARTARRRQRVVPVRPADRHAKLGPAARHPWPAPRLRRSGDVRLTTWDEIDAAGSVWTISAARMKAKREHRVPLCCRALEIPDAARTLGDGDRLVFPMRSGLPIPRRRSRRCSSATRLPPCPTGSGRRSGTGLRNGPTTRARSSRRRWPTWSKTRWRPPTPGRTCSSGDGGSWTIGRRISTDTRPAQRGADQCGVTARHAAAMRAGLAGGRPLALPPSRMEPFAGSNPT